MKYKHIHPGPYVNKLTLDSVSILNITVSQWFSTPQIDYRCASSYNKELSFPYTW